MKIDMEKVEEILLANARWRRERTGPQPYSNLEVELAAELQLRFAAPEAARTTEGWISVDDHLPPVSTLVIANTKEYGPLLADRTTRNPQHGWSCEGLVTHWMYLPTEPLPQEER